MSWDWDEAYRSYKTALRYEEEQDKLMSMKYVFKNGLPPKDDKRQLIHEDQTGDSVQAMMWNHHEGTIEIYNYNVDDWMVSNE